MKRNLIFILCLMMSLFSSISLFSQKKYKESHYLQQALEAMKQEDYSSAAEALEKEFKEHPENGYAHLYAAHLFYLSDDYGRALEMLDRAEVFLPKNDKESLSHSHYKRAGIYYSINRPEQALEEYSAALSIHYDPKIHHERAEIYYYMGEYDLSDRDYEQLRSRYPKDPIILVGLARNDIAQAQYGEALRLLDEVVLLYPDYSSGHSFRAEVYLKQGKYAQAADDIVQALAIDADDKAFQMMLWLPEELYFPLQSLLQAQRRKDPENDYWDYCLGIIAEGTARFPEAAQYYRKCIAQKAEDISYVHLASALEGVGDWSGSITAMEKAIELNPEDWSNVYLLADICLRAGDTQKFSKQLARFQERYPESSYSYALNARFCKFTNDLEGAFRNYSSALALNPENSRSLLGRGELYDRKGEEARAERDYQAVLQVDTIPEDGSRRMFALLHLGRQNEAMEWMDRMLENGRNATVLYDAAGLYAQMWETGRALAYLEEAVRLGFRSRFYLQHDPHLISLHGDPRFEALLQTCTQLSLPAQSE